MCAYHVAYDRRIRDFGQVDNRGLAREEIRSAGLCRLVDSHHSLHINADSISLRARTLRHKQARQGSDNHDDRGRRQRISERAARKAIWDRGRCPWHRHSTRRDLHIFHAFSSLLSASNTGVEFPAASVLAACIAGPATGNRLAPDATLVHSTYLSRAHYSVADRWSRVCSAPSLGPSRWQTFGRRRP